MKMKSASEFTVLALLALSTINSPLSTAFAQTPAGTVFTYDGKLQYGGSPVADGLYDFQFNLSNAPTGGSQVGSTVPRTAVPVTNGLFTITLDFGAVFTGNATWLAISVCSNGVGNFQSLDPLQELTPTPYAIFAESSSNVSGTVSAAQLTSVGNTVFPNLYNFFIGPAGNPATTGFDNTAIGVLALQANTGGNENTADGGGALQGNTIGSYNTAEGEGALYGNTIGSNNIALGFDAGDQITTGSSNIDIGNPGLITDTNIIRIGSGQTNTFIAGVINGNGGGLTNLNALQLGSIGNTSGGAGGNYFVGPSGRAVTTGSDNTALGYQAFLANTSGSRNTAIGYDVLAANTTGLNNTAVGASALQLNTSGYNNTSVGGFGLENNTTGTDNTALGYDAMIANTTGVGNTASGEYALGGNISGTDNTADGLYALAQNTIGGNNTAGGVYALYENTNGGNNTAYGFEALNLNRNGGGNTAEGYEALVSSTTGNNNVAIGSSALLFNLTGSSNTAVGALALYHSHTGNGNIGLGYEAGYNVNNTSSNNIDIGNVGILDENNTIRIGDPLVQIATYLAGTVYANNVQLTSDRNVKENFSAINPQEVLAKVALLPMSEWNYKTDSQGVQHIGPMAQDFQAVFQLSTDDKHISVVDEGGVALAAIQGLNQKLEETEQAAKAKDDEIRELRQHLEALEKIILTQKTH